MIEVKLIAVTAVTSKEPVAVDISQLASHAARTCYEPTEATGDKRIKIEQKIWPTGHHTVVQHQNFTFFIEGIPIGNITMGLHLAMPFYVSSQRSGRFCFGMFSDPAIITYIAEHIRNFYPGTTESQLKEILAYLHRCTDFYHNHLDAATKIAGEFIRKERPMASEKYITQNSKKFAQEQLRMGIPVIFPTGIDYTINFSALAALYQVAWDPVMLYLTDQMAQQVLALDPSLAYAFQRRSTEQAAPLPKSVTWDIHPTLKLRSMDDLNTAVWPQFSEMFPLDTLYFNRKFMPNNDIYIKTLVNISLATMGQDQRHRRINRGPFEFTGYMYCPPIAERLGLANNLVDISWEWITLSSNLHPALAQVLAPYGTMVEYTKSGDLNATMHEQLKRLCWCAQQEIYELSSSLREAISNHPMCNSELLARLSPPCHHQLQCGEGDRYCGRDLSIDRSDFFPRYRKV